MDFPDFLKLTNCKLLLSNNEISRKTITTVDLYNETSRVVYDENETPSMNYKEWALSSDSNYSNKSRVVSGGNDGEVNVVHSP